jgi:hypothetical protein
VLITFVFLKKHRTLQKSTYLVLSRFKITFSPWLQNPKIWLLIPVCSGFLECNGTEGIWYEANVHGMPTLQQSTCAEFDINCQRFLLSQQNISIHEQNTHHNQHTAGQVIPTQTQGSAELIWLTEKSSHNRNWITDTQAESKWLSVPTKNSACTGHSSYLLLYEGYPKISGLSHKEINNNNKHSQRSNTKCYGGTTH